MKLLVIMTMMMAAVVVALVEHRMEKQGEMGLISGEKEGGMRLEEAQRR